MTIREITSPKPAEAYTTTDSYASAHGERHLKIEENNLAILVIKNSHATNAALIKVQGRMSNFGGPEHQSDWVDIIGATTVAALTQLPLELRAEDLIYDELRVVAKSSSASSAASLWIYGRAKTRLTPNDSPSLAKPTITIGAESGEAINVRVAAPEGGKVTRYHVALLNLPAASGELTPFAAAAHTVDAGANGSLVSPAAASNAGLFDTETDGLLDLVVEDVVNGTANKVIVQIRDGGPTGKIVAEPVVVFTA